MFNKKTHTTIFTKDTNKEQTNANNDFTSITVTNYDIIQHEFRNNPHIIYNKKSLYLYCSVNMSRHAIYKYNISNK